MEQSERAVVQVRELARVRRHLRTVLDAGQRRHVADARFYQLLSDADRQRRTARIKRLLVTGTLET